MLTRLVFMTLAPFAFAWAVFSGVVFALMFFFDSVSPLLILQHLLVAILASASAMVGFGCFCFCFVRVFLGDNYHGVRADPL